jgi:hypothetical protein
VTRWPFIFALDDVEITGILRSAENPQVFNPAGDRVPGVWVKHIETGECVASDQRETREENLSVAFQRLDLILRRRERANGR